VIDFSPERARRLTWIVAAAGTLVTLAVFGVRHGAGFAIGALISYANIHSWLQIADALSGKRNRSIAASAMFMALRYLVIGTAIYATIKLLGTSPVAMILGLLASFAAVLLEVLYANHLK
jgi:hypothetical protein